MSLESSLSDEPGVAGGQISRRTTELGTAALGPLMVKLSIPGMVGMVSMALYNIAGTFWVGRLPNATEAIAALTVLFPFQMMAGACGMGVSAGVMSLASRRFGAAKADEANHAAGQGLMLACGLGVLLLLFGTGFPRLVVRALGASPELVEPSVAYLFTVSFGFPFAMMGAVFQGLYRGAGNTVTPMVITLSGVVLNALLDPFLILGWGPFPRLAIQGAGLAAVIGQIFSCCIGYLYLRRPESGYQVRLRHLRPDLKVCWDIAEVGAPAAATMVLRGVVASFSNHILAHFGPAAIAGAGLANRAMFLIIAFLGGSVNQALTPISGYAFGARDYHRMWKAFRIASIWTSVGGATLGLLIGVFAHTLFRPFATDPQLLEMAVLAARCHMASFWLVEPQMMASFTLQGMGFGTKAMWLTMTRGVLLIVPVMIILSHYFGYFGAYAAQPVADTLALWQCWWIVSRVYRKYPPSASATRLDQAAAAG